MDVGDYGCEFEDGHVVPIVFDRKSIGDLFGTMGKGYPRFKRCIKRAQESKVTLFIIVEGSMSKVLKGYEHSQTKGISMIYKLFTLWLRHGIQTIYCSDRKEMAEYITQFYIAAGKQYLKRKASEKG